MPIKNQERILMNFKEKRMINHSQITSGNLTVELTFIQSLEMNKVNGASKEVKRWI